MSWAVRLCGGLLATICSCGWSGLASGQPELDGEVPHVDSELCGDGPDAQAFVAALRVELSTGPQLRRSELTAAKSQGEPAEAAGETGPRLSECNVSAGRIELTRGARVVAIDVSDVPPLARPRTAAVAVAETLRYWRVGETTAASSARPAEPRGTTTAPSRPLFHGAPEGSLTNTPERAALTTDARLEAAAPARRGRWFDVGVALRGMAFGGGQTLAWGTSAYVGWRPLRALRAELRASYLTARDDSSLGTARLHAVPLAAALEFTWKPTSRAAEQLETRAGLSIEGWPAWVVVDSSYGFDEPGAQAWALLLDAHALLALGLTRDWALSLGAALSTDLRGVHLQAGGEGGFSLYGIGAGLQLGVERWF